MMINPIAGCYFPTTVLFVDDRQDYLESLKVLIDRITCYRFYTEPQKAIEYLQNDYTSTIFLQNWISHLNDQTVAPDYDDHHAFVDINLFSIHKEIYSDHRFSEVSVIVVDYAMPGMNGIEFSKQIKSSLKNSAIKILMLTGQADHAFGVDALNEGVIDYFITKESGADFKQKLNNAIKKLQLQYFIELSAPLIQNLTINPRCGLTNPAYRALFDRIKSENQILEYYLINDRGCFLMFDFEGNPYWLLVNNEEDMKNSYQCLVDNDLPKEIIQPVQDRKKLLFFFSDKDKIITSNDQWLQYLHPATKLMSEKEIYYYSFVHGKAAYDINLEKIVSYRKFLEKN